MKITEICRLGPVIPVIVIEDLAHAVPLSRALVKGGVRVLEVTLRTAQALEAIRLMVDATPEAIVGAGTLLTSDDVVAARSAGAGFGVSPGVTDELLHAASDVGLPLLPGAATASEVMKLAGRGYEVLKFFPAEQIGGVELLKAWAAPMPEIRFCPTGGISPANARSFLNLPNVLCVGGSWVCPKALMQKNHWEEITQLAQEAAALRV